MRRTQASGGVRCRAEDEHHISRAAGLGPGLVVGQAHVALRARPGNWFDKLWGIKTVMFYLAGLVAETFCALPQISGRYFGSVSGGPAAQLGDER